MRTVSVEYLRECLDYNQDTGAMTWLKRPSHHFSTNAAMMAWNGRYAGKKAGTINSRGYVTVLVDSKSLLGHRVAFALFHGRWPDAYIDHADGVRSNNAISNIRECSRSQNSMNRPLFKNSRTGLKGAKFIREGKYRSSIKVNSKTIHLGYFQTAEEAHAAYCEAANQNHGEFANLGEK